LPPEKTNSARETNTKSKNMMKKSSPREYLKLQDKTFQRGPVKDFTTVFDLLRDRISLESSQKSRYNEDKIFTSSHCAGIFVSLLLFNMCIRQHYTNTQ
jgi:hypothetical protein